MNLLLKITIIQFFLLASDCQIENNPRCELIIREETKKIRDIYGRLININCRTLNCMGGAVISEKFFTQWRSDPNGATDIIVFEHSYFHTIPALAFHELLNLKEIYLNATGTTILEVGCFLGLTKLEILKLDGNNIEEIEKGMLSNLPKLTMLSFSNNHLHTIHKDSFNGLINLELLLLDGNNLHFLPENLFSRLSRIKTIDLSRNYFETFNSTTFYNLIEMEHLYINSNRLKYLPPFLFKDLSNLNVLNISENSLTNISTEVFPGLERVTYLDISHNQLTILKANVLHFLSNLKELNIAHNNISFLNTDELTIFLPKLKEVFLQENNWTCRGLFSIIKTFRMNNVQVFPGKNYKKGSIIGIPCTNSSTSSSLISFTNEDDGQSTQRTDENQLLRYSHILMEIAGKMSDNNNLMEQLIHANLNSSKSIQIIAENAQKNSINLKPPYTPNILSNQNISKVSERTNELLENILNELRIERNNAESTTRFLPIQSRVNNNPPELNTESPQTSSLNQNVPSSTPNMEMFKFLGNIKAELEMSRTVLDTFMKNVSQTIASMQAKRNEPSVFQNKNSQLISERLQKNPPTSDGGNGNVALIVCLFVVVAILITILGTIYIRNNKGNFIANGLRRYRSNRPLGNRSDTDLMTNSRTLSSNSEV